jgi:peptidoglycan hydrolase CwlO-like protein
VWSESKFIHSCSAHDDELFDSLCFCRVKALESKISELESEVESLTERNSDLEEQLRKVGGKVEEHKSAIRGREGTAVKKAQKAKELQEEVQATEENIQDSDKEFVKNAQADLSATNQ